MTDQEIEELIRLEFDSKTLGVTEQYLKIHEPIYEGGLIKIDRIDREKGGNQLIAYLPVKGEYFSFAIYIDEANREINNIGTEARNVVRLRISSETMTSIEMLRFTKLKGTKLWEKGDKRGKAGEYKNSAIVFEPNPEPDEFEDKLKKLLTYLETDTTGILSLVSDPATHAYIQIVMDFHRGNQLLGGAILDFDSIERIHLLQLEIDFYFTAWGNAFK